MVFADFNLAGELDLVLPVCFDRLCSNSSMLQHTVKEVWEKGDKLEWKIMSLYLGDYRFCWNLGRSFVHTHSFQVPACGGDQ